MVFGGPHGQAFALSYVRSRCRPLPRRAWWGVRIQTAKTGAVAHANCRPNDRVKAAGRRGPEPATPLHDRDGVTRFQHRPKISSILIRNTVVPTAIRTTLGSCLAIEGVKSPKTRSCYEHHPHGRSKTVRTAVGRSILSADGIGRTSKPAAGEGEPADRRARAPTRAKEKPAGVNLRPLLQTSPTK